MKTKYWIAAAFALFLVIGPGHTGIAQQPNEAPGMDEKMKQQQMEEARKEEIRARKEMLEEQRKTREQEMELREFQRQQAEEARVRTKTATLVQPSTGTIYMKGGDPDFPIIIGESSSQTQLTLRNTFRGTTDSSNGTFDLGEDTRHFRCMINGKVQSGEITIKIEYPGGKTFKELTINSSAEISYNQALTIKDDDADKYIGAWKYTVKADKAEGSYMLQISTD
jgi:hypothetical protein